MVLEQTIKVLSDMTKIANMHLSINQETQIKSKGIDLNYLRASAEALKQDVLLPSGSIKLPDPCSLFDNTKNCSDRTLTQTSFEMANSLVGKNGKNESNIIGSKLISLSFSDGKNEIDVKNLVEPIRISIPRDANITAPDFEYINVSNITQNTYNQLLTYVVNLTSPNVSIHFQLKPLNESITYLMVIKYGMLPILNKEKQIYDNFRYACNKTQEGNESFYLMFSNIAANLNQTTMVGIGFRELNEFENEMFCINRTNLTDKPQLLSYHPAFSSDIYIRFYASGCYYLDTATGLWSSEGVDVLEETNSSMTVCAATHLTDFAGGFIILPPTIDFAYAFANASFDKNMTIYLTVIIITSIYILMFIWCMYKDRIDRLKTKILLLADNDPSDLYFYEMIVYTAGRNEAGTDSNVNLNTYT